MRRILIGLSALTLVIIAAVVLSFQELNDEISIRLKTKEFLAPTTYWALPESIEVKSVWLKSDVDQLFARHQYRQVVGLDDLKPGTYFVRDCDTPPFNNGTLGQCYFFRVFETLHPALAATRVQAFSVMDDGDIRQAYLLAKDRDDWQSVQEVRMEPHRVAQFVEGKPLLQEWVPLGEIPPNCLNAVLAIEDPKFLEHSGVNWKGLARAAIVNVLSARFAQGGSTITQQMVKNFFLNSEKTVSRKLKELGMSLALESKLGKDQIFEIYLNIIYLGQSGPFQIHGYSAAARHYFQKSITDLDLPECALLAAILNYPGGYDPFRNPDRALKRRSLVLTKMHENQMISDSELEMANQEALPTNSKPSIDESAPYFLEAVHRDLAQTGQSLEGLNVFTTMNLRDQEVAQKSLVQHLQNLESTNPALKKNAAKGLRLEGIAMSIETGTGRILSAVGGRGFRTSPFNRILDGRRQIGSLAKPFVYLTAFENDRSLTPLSPITDEKASYKIYKQVWSPENYTKKYYGEVSLTYALKNSLNAATAALGMRIGLSPILENLRKAGIQSPIEEVPALTLGAMDLKPIEVAEAYLTLARMGSHIRPRFFESLVRNNGQVEKVPDIDPQQVFSKDSTALVISMMKQATQSGTSQIIGKSGFPWPAAGKTGTTSDSHDAWFVGFTPWDMTLIWVGYDQNQTHGLTGASDVPVWLPIMKTVSEHRPKNDFEWPEGVTLTNAVAAPESQTIEILLRK